MKKMKLIFLIIIFPFSFCFSQVNFRDIPLKKVVNSDQIKSSQKKILVYFTTSWCGRCKFLDKQVFHDNKMSEFINNKYICLKIDGDSKKGKQIMNAYQVSDLYPTTLILDNSGNEVDRIIGYTSQKDYFGKIVDYYNDKNTLQDLLKRIKSEPNNGEIYLKLVMKYESYRNQKKQLFYMQKVLKFEPYKNNHNHWYHLCLLYKKNKNIAKAIESLNNAIKLAPGNSHYASYLERLKSKM